MKSLKNLHQISKTIFITILLVLVYYFLDRELFDTLWMYKDLYKFARIITRTTRVICKLRTNRQKNIKQTSKAIQKHQYLYLVLWIIKDVNHAKRRITSFIHYISIERRGHRIKYHPTLWSAPHPVCKDTIVW